MDLKTKTKNSQSKKQKRLSKFEFLGLGKEKDVFIENLAMLISSGVDIFYALESLKNESKSKSMKKLIGYIQAEVSDGSPIWRAFYMTNFFPEHIISLIKIGEESGRLPQNLQVIAAQQQKERVFRSKLRSAMMYPVFVLVLAVIIGLGISWFILPKLASVFSSMKMELPLVTRILISAGAFMGKYGLFFVPLVLVLMTIMLYFVFFFSKTKFIGQAILMKIPGVGNLIREIEMGRFGYLLGTLLEAGVPILNSLESIENASTTRKYRKMYGFIREKISEGNSFKKSFMLYKNSDKLIPLYIQNMIFAAEKSGKVSGTLLKIGNTFEEKTETTTKNLAVILEPVLLVVVWLGVVFIALAVILPIYNLIGGLNENRSTNTVQQKNPPPVEEIRTPEQNGVVEVNVDKAEESQTETAVEAELEEEVSDVVEGEASAPVEDNAVDNVGESDFALNKIEILDTGLGFLNVREKASTESEILFTVSPGEEYEYKSEFEDWYEIVVPEKGTGWVLGEYVKKISE